MMDSFDLMCTDNITWSAAIYPPPVTSFPPPAAHPMVHAQDHNALQPPPPQLFIPQTMVQATRITYPLSCRDQKEGW